MSDELIREYERVIDSGYKTLPIVGRPLPDGIYGVLAAFDSHIFSERVVRRNAEAGSLTLGQAQIFKWLGEGFSWAMRWLLQGNCRVDVRPSKGESLLSDAAALVQYGLKYHRATILYSGYSQRLMDAVVDPDKPLVKFSHKPNAIAENHTWAFAEEAATKEARKTPEWRKTLGELERSASVALQQMPHSLVDGRIMLHDPSQLCDNRVTRYVDWVTSLHRLLPPKANLLGFTVQDFDAYWRALYAWSLCTTHLYNCYCDWETVPQERCMPTQVVPSSSFLDSMTILTGLPREIVVSITDRLTADNRTKKLDMYLQPLVCGDKTVAWSVRAIQLSVHQRNLLKLMARTRAHKTIADQIIGDREKPFLAELKKWLEAKGWSTITNHILQDTEDAEIDLLGWHWKHPTEILVVEAKALLQADEPNELRSATEEMQRAQGQVERLTRILQEMPLAKRKTQFPFFEWDKITRWYGVVTTPESEPGFSFDHSTFPACSFETLKRRLSTTEWRSPSRLWDAMVKRHWQAEIRAGRVEYDSMELAGITFQDPCLFY